VVPPPVYCSRHQHQVDLDRANTTVDQGESALEKVDKSYHESVNITSELGGGEGGWKVSAYSSAAFSHFILE